VDVLRSSTRRVGNGTREITNFTAIEPADPAQRSGASQISGISAELVVAPSEMNGVDFSTALWPP